MNSHKTKKVPRPCHLTSATLLLVLICNMAVAARHDDCPDALTEGGAKTIPHGKTACAEDGEGSEDGTGVACTSCVGGHVLKRRCYKSNRWSEVTGRQEEMSLSVCYHPRGYPHGRIPPVAHPEEPCSADNCKLPDCFCHGARPEMSEAESPMFVVITYDDAVSDQRYEKYFRPFYVDNVHSLFNPSGCGIKTTLFVSMEKTKGSKVKAMWDAGNEVACHTVNHTLPDGYSDEDYLDTAYQIDGMRKIMLDHIGDFDLVNSIVGFRAPYLKVAHETQFKVLKDMGFLYDSSLTSNHLHYLGKPTWPYTLDYKTEICGSQFCPQVSYPGLWEVPLNVWMGDDRRMCWQPEYCLVGQDTEKATVQQWVDYFQRHFEMSYRTKTPLSFYTHTDMFDDFPNSFPAFVEWLQHLTQAHKDIWFVTVQQLLHWMKRPLTHQEMINIKWGC